jgi:hypothetical protein
METIQGRMRRATINEDAPMVVDELPPPKPFRSRTLEVKQQALNNWVRSISDQTDSLANHAYSNSRLLRGCFSVQGKPDNRRSKQKTGIMDLDEAIALEEQHNAFQREHRALKEARRERLTMPTRNVNDGSGRILSREEYESKVRAFMSYKPTDSDLEGEDEDDEDPDDEGTAELVSCES